MDSVYRLSRAGQSERLVGVVRRFRKHPGGVIGSIIVLMALCLAIAGGRVAPTNPKAIDLDNRLLPPLSTRAGTTHYLGTDQVGRDVLSNVISGARVSMTIGFVSVLGAGTAGLVLGLLGGYLGGNVDWTVRVITDTQMSIPFLLLALAGVAIFGHDVRALIGIFIATSWYVYTRPVRALVLSLRETAFIEAARAIGCSSARILLFHMLPSVLGIAAVIGSLELARIIVVEASLSFLGAGVPPSTPSWGSLISDGRPYLREAWWISAAPGVALTMLTVGVYLMGDALRDVFDPTSERWKVLR